MQRVKISILIFVVVLLMFIPVTAMGLYTPEVSEQHGVVTVRSVADIGWIVGGEFGLTDDLAIVTDVGDKDYNRAGIKFMLNPELAVIGGVSHSKLFLGFDFAGDFTDNITGIGEVDIYKFDDDQLATDYELGLKFNLTQQLDLRAGLLGTITQTDTSQHFQLGLGYRF